MFRSPREGLILAAFLACCFVAAGVGAAVTTPGLDDWYVALQKPSWTPPNWVFSPVWSVLYVLMAVAAWLVWRQRGWSRAGGELSLFGGQLFLNVLWSWLFFGLRNPAAAFGEIVVLWAVIAATLVAFWRVSALAGGLLVPYFVWVSFAAILNFSIWQMNS
jgi:tryptophan-rich sensory protein